MVGRTRGSLAGAQSRRRVHAARRTALAASAAPWRRTTGPHVPAARARHVRLLQSPRHLARRGLVAALARHAAAGARVRRSPVAPRTAAVPAEPRRDGVPARRRRLEERSARRARGPRSAGHRARERERDHLVDRHTDRRGRLRVRCVLRAPSTGHRSDRERAHRRQRRTAHRRHRIALAAPLLGSTERGRRRRRSVGRRREAVATAPSARRDLRHRARRVAFGPRCRRAARRRRPRARAVRRRRAGRGRLLDHAAVPAPFVGGGRWRSRNADGRLRHPGRRSRRSRQPAAITASRSTGTGSACPLRTPDRTAPPARRAVRPRRAAPAPARRRRDHAR